ncbi:MAG: polysaccharide deacetylase family protein [Rhizomicrobium sp.]|nr:polysaccharide deacetylase family protein [Rhizomicrobium sp.]
MNACLMLHGIGPLPPHVGADETPYWVSRETFDTIVELMQKIPARLTFDDGNATDETIALPQLMKAGLKASFFIPSARIGTEGYVSEDAIRELHRDGMEIGSHGCEHLDWTQVSDAEITHDVMQSVEQLSTIIQAPVRSVAIPYGYCDRRVLGVLRTLGMVRVYSSFRGPDSETAWLVRRDCIKKGMSREDILRIISRKPAAAETAINLLKVWRRAGNAALWTS